MSKRVMTPEQAAYAAQVGRRLKAARLALGKSQKQFADEADVGQTNISNVETATQRLGLDTALAICSAHPITLDWLYFGRNETLTVRMRSDIRKADPGAK